MRRKGLQILCQLTLLCQDREGGSGHVRVRVQHHLVVRGSPSNRSGSLDLETRYLQRPGFATFERNGGIVQRAQQVRQAILVV